MYRSVLDPESFNQSPNMQLDAAKQKNTNILKNKPKVLSTYIIAPQQNFQRVLRKYGTLRYRGIFIMQ
jgi:hypothetical protein